VHALPKYMCSSYLWVLVNLVHSVVISCKSLDFLLLCGTRSLLFFFTDVVDAVDVERYIDAVDVCKHM